jgi:hypothetical protein
MRVWSSLFFRLFEVGNAVLDGFLLSTKGSSLINLSLPASSFCGLSVTGGTPNPKRFQAIGEDGSSNVISFLGELKLFETGELMSFETMKLTSY